MCFLLFLYSGLLASSLPDLSVQELVEKNIQAVGGKEIIAKVENFSFRAGPKTYFVSSLGQMKIIQGKDPVVTEAILVDSEKVKKNCYNNISEINGLQKATYQAFGKLRGGIFTLINFKDQLELHGLKTFGPKKHYMLSAKIEELEVDFYLDSEEYMIKRVVFKGFDPEEGKYEVNHDFGPLQEVNGIKIPSTWYSSQVGTRGTLHQISGVTLNLSLDKDFFSKLKVNIGKVEILPDALSGNIIEFAFQRGMLLIGTNWTNQCFKKVGFKTKEKLILQISDTEIDIDFYESMPPRELIRPGIKIMMANPQDENYLILLTSKENELLSETLEPLLPIRVKRK